MKSVWISLINLMSGVAIYFLKVVHFPQIDNSGFYEQHISVKTLTIIMMFVVYIIYVAASSKYAKKFLPSSFISLLLFFIILFSIYYPFIDRNVILVNNCRGTFLKGNKLNENFLKSNNVRNYQNISKDKPAELIFIVHCDPRNAWTDINTNYHKLILIYFFTLLFFSFFVFTFLHFVIMKTVPI